MAYKGMSASPLPVFCLLGPTASGKTGFAVELRRAYGFEIVSVDSALVYKRMNIGTAKPDADTLAHSPHALINLIEPWESYSVSRFLSDVEAEIARIHAAGKVPLLVGGTMMYFHALWNGLSKLPAADKSVRRILEHVLNDKGAQHLHARLESVDAVSAARINLNDPQRLIRALEVYELTGTPLSRLQNRSAENTNYDFYCAGIFPEQRARLHQNIEKRFHIMLDEGFLEEVKTLLADPRILPDLPAMRCVGYRQACEYIAGNCTLELMSGKAIAATRQLAKRQLTWMRKMDQVNMFDLSLSLDKLNSNQHYQQWCSRNSLPAQC